MRVGHSPYLQQGKQCLQNSMPAEMDSSESKERDKRFRQPVSALIHKRVNSLSGQSSAACNNKCPKGSFEGSFILIFFFYMYIVVPHPDIKFGEELVCRQFLQFPL